jgi:hypothetical protein
MEVKDQLSHSAKPSPAKKRKASDEDIYSYEPREKIDRLLAKAIYSTGIPLDVMENPYWVDLFKVLRPHYKPPLKMHLTTLLLNEVYDDVRNSLNDLIRNEMVLYITTDAWPTSSETSSPIRCVIRTPNLSPLYYKPLESEPMCSSVDNLVEGISKLIEEVGSQRVAAFVAENSPFMKESWQVLSQRYPNTYFYGCTYHTTQALIQDVIETSTIKHLLTALTSVMEYCKDNSLLPTLAPWMANTRNWELMWYYLETMVKSKSMVQTHFLDTAKLDDTLKVIFEEGNFWEDMQGLHDYLQQFIQILITLEHEHVSLSIVYHQYSRLASHIEQSSFAKECLPIFQEHWEFMYHPALLLTHHLDPNYATGEIDSDANATVLRMITELAGAEDAADALAELGALRNRKGVFSNDVLWESSNKMDPSSWWMLVETNSPKLSKIARMLFRLPVMANVSNLWNQTVSQCQHETDNTDMSAEQLARLIYINWNLRAMKTPTSAFWEHAEH